MRVAMTRREAQAYVDARFEREDRVARPVPLDQAPCPAPFWPESFSALTMGHHVDRVGDHVAGSYGAVFQDGYLYFWSNDL